MFVMSGPFKADFTICFFFFYKCRLFCRPEKKLILTLFEVWRIVVSLETRPHLLFLELSYISGSSSPLTEDQNFLNQFIMK